MHVCKVACNHHVIEIICINIGLVEPVKRGGNKQPNSYLWSRGCDIIVCVCVYVYVCVCVCV